MKKSLLIFLSCCTSLLATAQLDTTSYPAERQELWKVLYQTAPGRDKACSDWVAVGPKGDISFTRKEWQDAQAKMRLVFKSFRILPGTEIIRVYERNCGVVHFVAEVTLQVADKPITLLVRRLEVYHRSPNGWCMVAGQGTEIDETIFPLEKKP